MSGNGNQVPLASSQRGPGPYPRAPTPHRAECFHPTGATGGAYMTNTPGGAQSSAQAAMRAQQTAQPQTAPPAQQQELAITTISGHNYVAQQNQTAQTRPQYQNFSGYNRATQHGNRPNTHPRQQQPYIAGTAATPTGTVMYPTLLYHQPPHNMFNQQPYPQPRTQGYPLYIPPYLNYNTPTGHTQSYYYSPNSQQLSAPNLQSNASGGRNNPTTLVGPQGTPATPTAPVATLPHPQGPTHMHQPMTGIRSTLVKKGSRRLPIINPVTQKDIFSEIIPNDNQYSGDSNERQTPQPDSQAHTIVEEFTRMVNEVANQPSASELKALASKNAEVSSTTSPLHNQNNATNSINTSNISMTKSDLLNINENKNVGPDLAAETIETPVVSAMSDSPVIVPKISNSKQIQKLSEQNIIVDNNKNVSSMKIQKSKPYVPQSEEGEKSSDNTSPVVASHVAASIVAATLPASVTPTVVPAAPLPEVVAAPAPALVVATPAAASAPEYVTASETASVPASMPVSASAPVAALAPASVYVSAPAPAPTPAPTLASTPAPTHAPAHALAHAPAHAPVHAPAHAPVHAPAHAPAPAPAHAHAPAPAPASAPALAPVPQPQRIREPRERKSEEKQSVEQKGKAKEKNVQETPVKPTKVPEESSPAAAVDDLPEIINPPTSQPSQETDDSVNKSTALETDKTETEIELKQASEPSPPTATELLSASIEKLVKEVPTGFIIESKEASSAIKAQAKLTQSIASCTRTNQASSKMKDINLNNETLDPDTANGNTTVLTKSEFTKEDNINKNEKPVKSSKNSNKKAANKMSNNNHNEKESDSYKNGKDETDKVANVEEETVLPKIEEPKPADKRETSPVFVPKYKYSEDQWSPLNKTGKKCYDIGFLKQIKDDPQSKNKPDVPLLEACNIFKTPMQESMSFAPISRTMNDTILPSFLKNSGVSSRNNTSRDAKKDGRNMIPSGKMSTAASSSSSHKSHIIHVSLSLREDVKLNQTENAWKPTRFKKENVTEEEFITQDLYKKFRGILNKLTPQKFDTLLDKVKSLDINTQKRLEGVIDLVFEKAIDEPNFSEAYAAMCNKLSMLKVPVDNATSPDQCVNFRALIISKCQNQFEMNKVDEQVLKLEKELAECTDPVKKKELQLQLQEENRKVRMRSVGNVRFIGELYKLKMLTSKIMAYCMNYLIEKLEEEKLECLCKLLTTIGQQVESEQKDQLDVVFRKMQDIAERKSNKISSRVRFMIQDVIALRKRKWVKKSVVDSQPKMMDQIQKEAEQQQRHIELMNANTMSGGGGGGGGGSFRREEGNRGKRGDSRRQGSNPYMDNQWKTSPRTSYTVDTSKFKAVTQNAKNVSNTKLAPQNSGWTHGSGAKNTLQATSSSMMSISKNQFSALDNVPTDPPLIRGGTKEVAPSYSKGASIERSTFASRSDDSSANNSRSSSIVMTRSNSGNRSISSAPKDAPAQAEAATAPPASVPQEPIPDSKKNSCKSMVLDLCLINPDDEEMIAEVKLLFAPKYHASLVTEILNVALERPAKEIPMIAKSLLHLVSTNTISQENFISGIGEILEFASDIYIDVPMLYDYLGKFIAPHIEKKHITFKQLLGLCENIVSAGHGHLLLKAVIKDLRDSMGPSFVKSKWQDSGLQLKDWMKEDQVASWIAANKFEFLEGGAKPMEETKTVPTPAQTQSKLLQLMNADESCECIKGWVQDNLGKNSNEDWFMRCLIQAICEHALSGAEHAHFSLDKMNKYSSLINEFGESREAREASCLFGIQQLIHRLEHPQGLTLEIFQYLHEQYIITVDGFIAWEVSEKEPEGKAVMKVALTSFFTNIREADNEDSCSED